MNNNQQYKRQQVHEEMDALDFDLLVSELGSIDNEELKNTIISFRPKIKITAPSSLKKNIIDQIKKEKASEESPIIRSIKWSRTIKRTLAVAAMVSAILFVIPFIGRNNRDSNTANAAASLFMNAINAVDSVKTMDMDFNVRTAARDNFNTIGTDYAMVAHQITEKFEQPAKWKVEKEGRVVLFDGKNQYLWVPEIDQAIKGPAGSGFVGWFEILLNPATILWKEEVTAKENASGITMKKNGNQLFVTIVSKQKDYFLNDYLKDKNLDESDNRREYVFDDRTKLLKGLKIYLLYEQKETLIFEIGHIEYNNPIENAAFSINLPQGVEWHEFTEPDSNAALSDIDSKKAAEMAFDDLSKSDFNAHKGLWSQFNFFSKANFKNAYSGLQIIKIGEPFKSGKYPGEFVPYTIRMSDGNIKTWAIALRNDNPNKVWIVDGGI